MIDEADRILERFYADPELQRLKKRAEESHRPGPRRYTMADAERDTYLIQKSFFMSGYDNDMIRKALRKKGVRFEGDVHKN